MINHLKCIMNKFQLTLEQASEILNAAPDEHEVIRSLMKQAQHLLKLKSSNLKSVGEY
mgnify:CR=1 FL=1